MSGPCLLNSRKPGTNLIPSDTLFRCIGLVMVRSMGSESLFLSMHRADCLCYSAGRVCHS